MPGFTQSLPPTKGCFLSQIFALNCVIAAAITQMGALCQLRRPAAATTVPTSDDLHSCRCTMWPRSAAAGARRRNTPSLWRSTLWTHTQRCDIRTPPLCTADRVVLVDADIEQMRHTDIQSRHRSWMPQVTKAKVWVEQKAWQRIAVNGQPHNHGRSCALCGATSSDDGNSTEPFLRLVLPAPSSRRSMNRAAASEHAPSGQTALTAFAICVPWLQAIRLPAQTHAPRT